MKIGLAPSDWLRFGNYGVADPGIITKEV